VIGEIHLRRDEPDGRAGPPHEPDEQSRLIEVEVGERLRGPHPLHDVDLIAVDSGPADAPPGEGLLDAGGKRDDRLESGAIEVAFGERQQRYRLIAAGHPSTTAVEDARAATGGQLYHHRLLVWRLRIN